MFRKVAIDVDEVLVNLLYPMAAYNKHKLPKNKKYKYLYREIFNVTEEESQKILKEFYNSKEFKELKPISGSQYTMSKLKKYTKKMYVVTGRQEIIRKQTELWIETFFPGIFDDVILTNSFTENEIKKVDVCKALNIDCIVDDNIQICRECMDAGMKSINYIGYDVYPWCDVNEISIRGWGVELSIV